MSLSSLLSPIATEMTRSQLSAGLDTKKELISPWDVPFLIHQGQRWSGFEVSLQDFVIFDYTFLLMLDRVDIW